MIRCRDHLFLRIGIGHTVVLSGRRIGADTGRGAGRLRGDFICNGNIRHINALSAALAFAGKRQRRAVIAVPCPDRIAEAVAECRISSHWILFRIILIGCFVDVIPIFCAGRIDMPDLCRSQRNIACSAAHIALAHDHCLGGH